MIRIFSAYICLFVFAFTQNAYSQTKFKHVVTFVFENEDFSNVMKIPYFAKLTTQGAIMSNLYAETHPSQPNYLALTSGSTQGVGGLNGDDDVDLNVKNVADLIEAKGLTWASYAENFPGQCFTGSTSGLYARKHNPFISYTNIRTNPARCAHIVGFETLLSDWQSGKLPNYSFIAPNIDDDGHEPPYVSFAATWLQKNFDAIFSNPQFMQDTLVVLTFDEGSVFSSNQVYTVLLGPSVVPGSKATGKLSHYSLLKLVEDEWGLGNLGLEDSRATAITGVWR